MAALTPRGSLQPVDLLRLRDLLRAAFTALPQMNVLLLGINRDFNDYYGLNDDYPEAVQKLVSRANEELWWRGLVAAARAARPTDPQLAAFAAEFDRLGTSPIPRAPAVGQLE